MLIIFSTLSWVKRAIALIMSCHIMSIQYEATASFWFAYLCKKTGNRVKLLAWLTKVQVPAQINKSYLICLVSFSAAGRQILLPLNRTMLAVSPFLIFMLS